MKLININNLDGTENKSNLGANSILAVSIANLKAAAKFSKKEIFEYIKKKINSVLYALSINEYY